jgi:simple sugar transport system permease protein
MIDLPFQALRISVPYVLAALGGTISERSGTVNIGLEGMMLIGAFGAVVGTLATGSPLLGLVVGLGAGALLAGLHAVATGVFKADHIVSGLALNLLAAGLTRVLLQRLYHSSSNSPRIPAIESLAAGNGLLVFLTHPLIWATAALVVAVWWMLSRTVLGLRLRAVGEHPEAAAAAGLSVVGLRATGVVLSGLLAGLSGVWLAFDQHQFTDAMSGGRGYIALAAMIFGRWMPVRAAVACMLFGTAEALQIALQQSGQGGIPIQLVQTLPYVLTLIALAGAIGRATPPAALGRSRL